MKKTAFISGILLLMLIFSQSLCAGNSKEESTVSSSDSWLSLVDSEIIPEAGNKRQNTSETL